MISYLRWIIHNLFVFFDGRALLLQKLYSFIQFLLTSNINLIITVIAPNTPCGGVHTNWVTIWMGFVVVIQSMSTVSSSTSLIAAPQTQPQWSVQLYIRHIQRFLLLLAFLAFKQQPRLGDQPFHLRKVQGFADVTAFGIVLVFIARLGRRAWTRGVVVMFLFRHSSNWEKS